jgi:hypothetical protein
VKTNDRFDQYLVKSNDWQLLRHAISPASPDLPQSSIIGLIHFFLFLIELDILMRIAIRGFLIGAAIPTVAMFVGLLLSAVMGTASLVGAMVVNFPGAIIVFPIIFAGGPSPGEPCANLGAFEIAVMLVVTLLSALVYGVFGCAISLIGAFLLELRRKADAEESMRRTQQQPPTRKRG